MTVFDEPGHFDEERFLEALKPRLDRAVQRVARHHYFTKTQEPQLTPRLAQAIESEVDHFTQGRFTLDVEIATQDIPDRGTPAEKNSGTDLYISTARLDLHWSKGILVQAKWVDDVYDPTEHVRLVEQCKKMRKRAKTASFVWVFAPDGVHVIRIPRLGRINVVRAYERESITPGALITESLRCNEGELGIGRDLRLELPDAMNSMVERLGAKRWIAMTLKRD